jgi:elongation factor P--beta-lysine ligase
MFIYYAMLYYYTGVCMEKTSIRVGKELLQELQDLKVHHRETYEEVIWRLVKAWKSTQSK